MARKVNTEKGLGQALKDDVEMIEIEGDLAKKAFRIRATGKLAWAVCAGALGVAICAALVTAGSAGTAAPATVTASLMSAGAATTFLGWATAYSAFFIGVADPFLRWR